MQAGGHRFDPGQLHQIWYSVEGAEKSKAEPKKALLDIEDQEQLVATKLEAWF